MRAADYFYYLFPNGLEITKNGVIISRYILLFIILRCFACRLSVARVSIGGDSKSVSASFQDDVSR